MQPLQEARVPRGSNGRAADTMDMMMNTAAQIYSGVVVVVSPTCAITADSRPMIRLHPTETPLPVVRWAEGSTSAVYA